MPTNDNGKHQLWFKSPLFAIEEGEDEETNPHCYGRQFATWLAGQLRKKQVAVESVVPEDWGWCVIVKRAPYLLWVGCGNIHESVQSSVNDTSANGADIIWTCMVVAEIPFLRRLFGAVNTEPAVQELFDRVAEIIALAPGTVMVAEP